MLKLSFYVLTIDSAYNGSYLFFDLQLNQKQLKMMQQKQSMKEWVLQYAREPITTHTDMILS